MKNGITLKRRQLMETGILMALGFLFFAYNMQRWDFMIIAGAVLLISLLIPILFYPFAYLWFGLAKILSYLTSNLLLTALFFILVSPIGLVRRWLGKDSLRLKDFKKGKDSALKLRNEKIGPHDLRHPF